MDNQVPVTETEMREFFARVMTSFVSLSQQAAELNEVQRSLADVQQKLSELSGENERLRKSESDAWSMAHDADKALELANVAKSEAESKAQWQQEVIIGRDARVAELESQLRSVTEERDAIRSDHERLKAEHEGVQQSLEWHKADLTQAHDNAVKAARERDTAVADLAKIRSIISPTPEPEPLKVVSGNW